jgi:hypothetical protein
LYTRVSIDYKEVPPPLGAGWLMATYMYDLIKDKHKAMLVGAPYISLTVDETSTVDNLSYIVIHVYVL